MSALTLPALTVRQPWASLIALGVKRYETRGWRPRSLGPDRLLAIHAGVEPGEGEAAWQAWERAHGGKAPTGAVLCVVEVEATLDVYSGSFGVARLVDDADGAPVVLSREETALGDYTPGRWAWRLRVVERFEQPIPARGRQCLWRWTRPGAAGGAS